jgi:hypothetical protein
MRVGTVSRDDGSCHAAVFSADRVSVVNGFRDAGELIRAGDAGWDAARTAAEGPGQPIVSDELRCPILSPSAIVCVGLNYRRHIEEMGRELPQHPTLFAKLPRALTGPCGDIALPRFSSQIDYEAELAVVIGRLGRYVGPADAWSYGGRADDPQRRDGTRLPAALAAVVRGPGATKTGEALTRCRIRIGGTRTFERRLGTGRRLDALTSGVSDRMPGVSDRVLALVTTPVVDSLPEAIYIATPDYRGQPPARCGSKEHPCLTAHSRRPYGASEVWETLSIRRP